jgi:hypothetical protein
VIHYHGTPITPRATLYELAGRNFCVSYAAPNQVDICHQIGQSVMLDNGAYSVWKRGAQIDWQEWYDWVQPWLEYQTTWAVLPDSIEGDEFTNDHLASEWAWMLAGLGHVVPVWHLHESFARLSRLVDTYSRVCFGSSGAFSTVGDDRWRRRVSGAFDRISNDFGRVPWVHMLRGMSMSGDYFPFASVDSTDIARNHNRPHNGARAMADRWDALQCPPRWHYTGTQLTTEDTCTASA